MTGPLVTHPLVSTQWLADHLGADDLVIVDASVLPTTLPNGRTAYVSGHETYLLDGHVSGAVFADLLDDFSDRVAPHPFTRTSVAALETALGALGVGDDSTVVIYDRALGQWASRLWWLLRAAGFDRAAVLDGGLDRWRTEGRPVEVGHVAAEPRTVRLTERPQLWADKVEVEDVVAGRAAAALVCALPAREFAGLEGGRPRLGHIPGSVSAPVASLVDRDTREFLPEDRLRDVLADGLNGRTIVYCHGGIAASAAAFALVLAGAEDVAVYDESLSEWAADPAAPLVTAA